jgi:hypothetical protein
MMWAAVLLICHLGVQTCDTNHSVFTWKGDPVFSESACIDDANDYIVNEFLDSDEGAAEDGWVFDTTCVKVGRSV